MSNDRKPPPEGVAEGGAPFRAPVDSDWTIALERLEEYRRTGETISVDEFMEELRREVASRRTIKR
ncbi:hypothetical protein [Caulobacter mirabilis]|uniref:Uncharacterized protein n=1 Tax=Caulobacter mirabilis TaxID=69666 RepID=A0A2D2B2B5_9CAUL|nr:hypothetical protein [Caulobacter mirabilis]ATQ44384.1 hypothetical protein CSW64_19330 [Caulobacter mirabilis]